MKRIFLDYASTTPIDKKVLKAMKPFMEKQFHNPSSIYTEGIMAKKALIDFRTKIARVFGCQSDEVIFTGSGTESDNLAILGVFEKAKKKITRPHVITTDIEHPAVLEAVREIERRGGEVTFVKPNEDGIILASSVISKIKENTVLVSVMLANNEIGTIQPVGEIGRKIREWRDKNDSGYPFFHTDACQAANYVPVGAQSLSADLISLDGSKIYGPKGVGVLVARSFVPISPIIFGGGQEKGLRSGTENLAAIAGMSEALVIANDMREKECARLLPLRDFFIDFLLKEIPGTFLNGSKKNRLPNNVNVCIPNIDAEFAVIKLDKAGIACSFGSSCATLGEAEGSYVLEALGRKNCSTSSLRFSFGRFTNKVDIKRAANIVIHTIKNLKKLDY